MSLTYVFSKHGLRKVCRVCTREVNKRYVCACSPHQGGGGLRLF